MSYRIPKDQVKEILKQAGKSKSTSKLRNAIIRDSEGTVFRSKAEADRWPWLRLLEKQGKIFHLQKQVPCPLLINGQLICKYVADYVYWNHPISQSLPSEWWSASCHPVVEDVKGHRTYAYKLKAKHFAAQYGFPITEIKVGK